MPPGFVTFWLTGEGAARIRWNTDNDYERCITEIQAEVTKHGRPPLSDRMIHGACATLHKLATGGSPGHGSAE